MRLLLLLALGPPWAAHLVAGAGDGPLAHGWSSVHMGPRSGAPVTLQGYSAPGTIVRGGPGLIAWGQNFAGSPFLWSSADGRHWKLAQLDAKPFPHRAKVLSVASGALGLVAVGGYQNLPQGPNPSSDQRLHALAWFSPDGRTWRRTPNLNHAFDDAWMLSVTAGGPGFVAVGRAGRIKKAPPPAFDAAVWTSTDGLRWQRVSDTGATFQHAEMLSAVAGGPGLVAVGWSSPDNPSQPTHVVIWTSADGRTWQRLPWDKAVFPARSDVYRVVAGSKGLVAWGYLSTGAGGGPVLWTSPDGLGWTRVHTWPFPYGSLRSVAPRPPGFVAVGDYDNEPSLWSSSNGSRWTREAGEDAFGGGDVQLTDVVAWKGGLVVVGTYGSPVALGTRIPSPLQPTAWLWSPSSNGASHPNWSKTDPKWFRLRIADFPPGFQVGGGGYYLECVLDQALEARSSADFPPIPPVCQTALAALGPAIPYTFRFAFGPDANLNNPYVGGFAILAQTGTRARAAFRYAGGLVVATDLNGNARSPTLLSARPKIGQAAKVYRERTARWGTAYGVVWRDGRALGVVEVVGVPGDREKLAISLAGKEWHHWRSLTKARTWAREELIVEPAFTDGSRPDEYTRE